MGLVLLMMALLLWGVQEASAVNAVTTLVAVGAIIVTIVAGGPALTPPLLMRCPSGAL